MYYRMLIVEIDSDVEDTMNNQSYYSFGHFSLSWSSNNKVTYNYLLSWHLSVNASEM